MGTFLIKKFASTSTELAANYVKKKREPVKKSSKACKEDHLTGIP